MQERPLVLIADDEPAVVSSVARYLERAGVRCIFDLTSKYVQDLARTHRPDLVLLDIRQRIDGRDLLGALKRDAETREIRVVVLSAVDDQFLRHHCLELGAEDFVLKPFDIGDVRRLVRMAGGDPDLSASPVAVAA